LRFIASLTIPCILLITSACTLLEPEVERGGILFQDDFSHPASGWDRYHDDVYISDYSNGIYRIAVFSSNTQAWARPHLTFSDVRIDVIAAKSSGPDDNIFGIICRYQDARNFYFLGISSDGYSGIGMYRGGVEILLSADTMQPSNSIRRGQATNYMRAECIGDLFTLYVNDTIASVASDETWSEGDIGLFAGSYDLPGTDVFFDNYSVIKP
jgi:hypothetical protein